MSWIDIGILLGAVLIGVAFGCLINIGVREPLLAALRKRYDRQIERKIKEHRASGRVGWPPPPDPWPDPPPDDPIKEAEP